MGADGRADQDLSVTCGVEADLTSLIEHGCLGILVFLLDFLSSESPDEDWSAVPDDLQDLSGRNFGDIDLKIGIPIISGPPIESADDGDGVQAGKVGHGGVVDCAQHVDLGSADVGLVLVVHSVLVEPVVQVGLEVNVVSEVAGTGRGHEELGLVGDGVVVIELLGGALVVLADQAEVESRAQVVVGVRWVSRAACLSFDKNNILLDKYIAIQIGPASTNGVSKRYVQWNRMIKQGNQIR